MGNTLPPKYIRMKKKKKRPPPPKSRATICWPVLAFLSLALLVFYQYMGEISLCDEGIEVSAEVVNIGSAWSEDHEYGRSIKILNVELAYAVAGKSVSAITSYNDGEAGKIFSAGVSVGDTVSLLVDEEKPERFKLASGCGR